MMRAIYILIFFFIYTNYIGIAQEIETATLTTNNNEPLCIRVTKQLELDPNHCDTEFFMKYPMPEKDKTIVILAVLNDDSDEDDEILDAYILLVDSTTGDITQTFFRERFWQSDAIFLSDIEIDSEMYKVSKDIDAFAIRSYYRTNSQPNPYSEEYLSLFVAKEDQLLIILDQYQTSEYQAEWDMNCAGASTKVNNKIGTTDQLTNEYYDLQVSKTINHRRTFLEGDDCQEEMKTTNAPDEKLVFMDGAYMQLTKND